MIGNFQNKGIHAFGETTIVPDDDVAKLMYYLHCVDTVINYNEIDKLSDYENYNLLTIDDMTELFKLVLLFNPKIFIDAGIFILDDSLLPYGFDNHFYQITDERIGVYVNNQIMIGGRTVQVLKVMVCNQRWLVRNYYRPWKNIFELTEKYQRYKNSYYVPPPPINTVYTPPRPANPDYFPPPKIHKRQNENCGCICN